MLGDREGFPELTLRLLLAKVCLRIFMPFYFGYLEWQLKQKTTKKQKQLKQGLQ